MGLSNLNSSMTTTAFFPLFLITVVYYHNTNTITSIISTGATIQSRCCIVDSFLMKTTTTVPMMKTIRTRKQQQQRKNKDDSSINRSEQQQHQFPPSWSTLFFDTFLSSTSSSTAVESAVESTIKNNDVDADEDSTFFPTDNQHQQQSIAAPRPREFDWWNEECDTYLDALDSRGGIRFVASHDIEYDNEYDHDDAQIDDDPTAIDDDNDNNRAVVEIIGESTPGRSRSSSSSSSKSKSTHTNNWLHVTSSSPERRVQYEIRYVGKNNNNNNTNCNATSSPSFLAGIVRFGVDCEGPPGLCHGGSIATVADALTATAVYQVSDRWGYTTRLDCQYRQAVPLKTPVKVEAHVIVLKKRKAIVEWNITSVTTQVDRNGNDTPVRYAFGSAEFLLPRK